MAGIAFQVDAEENLRGVLGGLHGGRLAGADGAAPVDADEETSRVGGRGGIEELGDKLIVRKIVLQAPLRANVEMLLREAVS